jgi:hypothetical protein
MTRIIPFTELRNADRFVDAVYESAADGQLSGEPIARLLPGSGNQGGFRASGRGNRKTGSSCTRPAKTAIGLTSSM